MSSMGSSLLQFPRISTSRTHFGKEGSLMKCQLRHKEKTAEIWAHLSSFGDCTSFLNHRVFRDLSQRVPYCCGKTNSTQAFLTVPRAESVLFHVEQRLALKLNAKHRSPTQTSRTSSKDASVTQCPCRIHQRCENPGKELPNLGESEGTSGHFRHTAVEHLSQKMLQGILQVFRHAWPATQKLRHPPLKSYESVFFSLRTSTSAFWTT